MQLHWERRKTLQLEGKGPHSFHQPDMDRTPACGLKGYRFILNIRVPGLFTTAKLSGIGRKNPAYRNFSYHHVAE
jgi:hypothetical protein